MNATSRYYFLFGVIDGAGIVASAVMAGLGGPVAVGFGFISGVLAICTVLVYIGIGPGGGTSVPGGKA